MRSRSKSHEVAYLDSHISRYMTPMPGDIISTGTTRSGYGTETVGISKIR